MTHLRIRLRLCDDWDRLSARGLDKWTYPKQFNYAQHGLLQRWLVSARFSGLRQICVPEAAKEDEFSSWAQVGLDTKRDVLIDRQLESERELMFKGP